VAVAAEIVGTGVTVNAVYPGPTDTAMPAQLRNTPDELIGAEQRAHVRERYARGEFSKPLDIGRLILAIVLSDSHGEIIKMSEGRAIELLRTHLD
jgi:NAD(P)-dependent dehydrogenase (short-subunit alcohol dehydrogenase family)